MKNLSRIKSYLIIAILILVAVIGVIQMTAPDEYDGSGGINYDPECYPFDERGVPPSQRGPWLNRQPTPYDRGAIEQLLRAEIVRDYLKSKEHAGAVIGFSIAAGYPGIVGGAVLGMTVQPQPLSQQRERISE